MENKHHDVIEEEREDYSIKLINNTTDKSNIGQPSGITYDQALKKAGGFGTQN